MCEFIVSFPLQDNIPRHPSPPVVVWQLKHCPVASHIIRHCPLTPFVAIKTLSHCKPYYSTSITPRFCVAVKTLPRCKPYYSTLSINPLLWQLQTLSLCKPYYTTLSSSPLFVTIKPCVHRPISMSPLAYMINCLQSCLRYEWESLWSRSYDNWI